MRHARKDLIVPNRFDVKRQGGSVPSIVGNVVGRFNRRQGSNLDDSAFHRRGRPCALIAIDSLNFGSQSEREIVRRVPRVRSGDVERNRACWEHRNRGFTRVQFPRPVWSGSHRDEHAVSNASILQGGRSESKAEGFQRRDITVHRHRHRQEGRTTLSDALCRCRGRP